LTGSVKKSGTPGQARGDDSWDGVGKFLNYSYIPVTPGLNRGPTSFFFHPSSSPRMRGTSDK